MTREQICYVVNASVGAASLSCLAYGHIRFGMVLLLSFTGGFCNLAAVYANNGKMPAATADTETDYHRPITNARLRSLCDVIKLSKHTSISVGDVLLYLAPIVNLILMWSAA